jgi:hypothetical protein
MKVLTIKDNRERVKQIRNKITKTQKDIMNLLTNADSNFKNILFDESDKKIYFDIEDDTFMLDIHIKKKRGIKNEKRKNLLSCQ